MLKRAEQSHAPTARAKNIALTKVISSGANKNISKKLTQQNTPTAKKNLQIKHTAKLTYQISNFALTIVVDKC